MQKDVGELIRRLSARRQPVPVEKSAPRWKRGSCHTPGCSSLGCSTDCASGNVARSQTSTSARSASASYSNR